MALHSVLNATHGARTYLQPLEHTLELLYVHALAGRVERWVRKLHSSERRPLLGERRALACDGGRRKHACVPLEVVGGHAQRLTVVAIPPRLAAAAAAVARGGRGGSAATARVQSAAPCYAWARAPGRRGGAWGSRRHRHRLHSAAAARSVAGPRSRPHQIQTLNGPPNSLPRYDNHIPDVRSTFGSTFII